jgi:DNA replication protein DnaC
MEQQTLNKSLVGQTVPPPRQITDVSRDYWQMVKSSLKTNDSPFSAHSRPNENGAGADCPRCDGQGYVDHYQTADGRDFGVKASRMIAFRAEYPDAQLKGMQPCGCQEQRRLGRLWGTAGIPKHRRHCTFDAFDSLPEEYLEGKQEARFYAGEMAQGSILIRNGVEKNSLMLSGKPGMGKSGMMACIARYWLDRGENVLWVDFGEFIEAIKASYDETSKVSAQTIVESAQRSSLLCFDDFGDMARDRKPVTDHTRERTYDVIRYRYENELPTVITSNLDDEQLYAQFGGRIADRIGEMSHFLPMVGANLRFA